MNNAESVSHEWFRQISFARLNVVLESHVLKDDTVRVRKRKITAPTGLSYNDTTEWRCRLQGPTDHNGVQSSHRCVVPAMHQKQDRFSLRGQVLSLTVVSVLPGRDE